MTSAAEFLQRVDPTVSLISNMTRRKISSADAPTLRSWLLATGWEQSPGGRWARPDEIAHAAERQWPPYYDWSLPEAVRLNAECVAAALLRSHGWHAPHAFGLSCSGNLCRAPGTWRGSNAGGCSAIHGTSGRWVSLRTALRTGGFDAVGFRIRGATCDEIKAAE